MDILCKTDILDVYNYCFIFLQSPDDNLSPAQEALLHIQSQIVDLTSDSDSVITTRLLVPANQVGCLIGKGGSIISEMRRATGANIRILPRKDLPQCALETDELVQVCQFQSIFSKFYHAAVI